MAILHVMHGFIGSGKTTFAKKLAEQTGALRLNNDEWMCALYGSNPPEEHFNTYYKAIEKLQWQMAMHTLNLGGDVIIDCGYWQRARRTELNLHAEALDIKLQWYSSTCPYEVMRERTLKRTAALPEGQLFIDANAFDTLWKQFEPLSEDEPKAILF